MSPGSSPGHSIPRRPQWQLSERLGEGGDLTSWAQQQGGLAEVPLATPRPADTVLDWLDRRDAADLLLSAITTAEIEFGTNPRNC